MLMVGQSSTDEFGQFNAREYNRGDVAIMADIREMGGGKHKVPDLYQSRQDRIFDNPRIYAVRRACRVA
jgi:hypothetical protein